MISTLLVALVGLSSPALAQDLALPVLSPRATVSQQVGTVTVSVDYSSPSRRDRAVFGELVPFDKTWRTGANGATTLTVDGDITLGGVALAAGSYALMSIPGESEWTIILNTDLGARPWRHDESLDLERFKVKGETVDGSRENLTFLFEDTTDRASHLVLEWADRRVAMPIAVDTSGRGAAAVEGYVAMAGRRLSQAARFHMDEGNLDEALTLAQKAVAVGEDWYAQWALTQVLHAREEHKDAYKSAKRTEELGADDDNFFYADAVAKALEEWPKK